MTKFGIEQIKQAVSDIKKLRPAYTEILNYYEQIFTAKKDSETEINTEPVQTPENKLWEKGSRPICGNFPVLSVFEEQGQRFLYCGSCWHKWAFQRICCPFCENRNTDLLYYFFSEQEKNYRVDVCDKCRRYIKTIDIRNFSRIFYPPLEHISTLHLDMMAKEKGLVCEYNL